MMRSPFLVCCALFALAGPVTADLGYSVKSDGDDALYTVEMMTGRTQRIGATGFGDVESLAFSPGCGTLYAVDDVKDVLLRCDRGTGACTEVGPLRVDVTDTGLAFAADGKLYMSTDAPNPPRLYQLDLPSGRADVIGEQGTPITGLAGGAPRPGCASGLYGLGGDADLARGRPGRLYCVDTSRGTATAIGRLGVVDPVDGGLEMALGGVIWGLDDQGAIFWVDYSSGRAAIIQRADPARRGFEGLAIDGGVCADREEPSVVDVPAAGPVALAALAAALATLGMGVLRRRDHYR